ncbi:MAG: hypothetical protein ACRDHZ_15540, partial [Ktedonobacteraceae bacterium]
MLNQSPVAYALALLARHALYCEQKFFRLVLKEGNVMSGSLINTILLIALVGVIISGIGFVLTYQPDKKVFMIICIAVEITVIFTLIGANIFNLTHASAA